MDKFNFRRAVDRDYDVINKFNQALFDYHKNVCPEVFEYAEFEDYNYEDFLHEVSDDDKAWFVAEYDGNIVGAVLSYITADRFNQIFCYVDSLYVEPQFRNQGVASKLMSLVEDFSKKNGVNSLQLNVWVQNVAGMQFYKKLGLEPTNCKFEKKILRSNDE